MSCTLWDIWVCEIPLNVKGSIGERCNTLLLGRLSTTLMGLFALPGVINADYEGITQAMAWTPSPPVLIPKRTRIAQLMLFEAIVPQAETRDQHNMAFGLTGPPSVFWASAIAIKRPTLTLTLHHPEVTP